LTSAVNARDPIVKWLSKRPVIKRVEITGNEYIESDEIKSAISTREQGFFAKTVFWMSGMNFIMRRARTAPRL
jgi:outer membrane protein assembly factor BamA